MPEAEFRMFIEVLDIIPEKSTFYTGEKYVPVLQWCTGEKVNSISCVSDIPSEAGSKPVYVIVENDSVLIKNFPAANKQIISDRNFSCIAIAPATDK